MQREEKRRKFHESVVNTLFPSPSSPPQAVDEEKTHANTLDGDFSVELIDADDYLKSNSSSNDDDGDEIGESEDQKLTRAQRKRLRKKKIKEEVSRRRGIIGPLLLERNNEENGENWDRNEGGSQSVRQNADEKCADTFENPGEQPGCRNQKKIKQRRKAKKLARDKLKICSNNNQDQDQSFKHNINGGTSSDQGQNIKSSTDVENCNQVQQHGSQD